MNTFKQISLLCLFWMIGMSVWAYDFAATNADGVTIYYNITSTVSPKTVEVTYGDDSYTAETINIPNTVDYDGNTYDVTGIGEQAFYWIMQLKHISLPKYLTSIGRQAFEGCASLTSITIPNSVTSIGIGAFSGCFNLTSVTIPNSVKSIEDYAFSGCDLTSVTIPDSVISIGSYAFTGCYSLTSVTIPNSVTSIGSYAFSSTSLTSVTIPNSVKNIGENVFSGCSNLEDITIDITSWENSIWWEDLNYFNDMALKYQYDGKKLEKEICIPSSITKIGAYALYNCKDITQVKIPTSVTDIGQSAFENCSNATIIFTSQNKPTVGAWAFYNTKAVYHPKFYGWSYIPYTNLTLYADGSVNAKNLDDWREFEIKDEGKEYIVPQELNYYFMGASYTRTFNNHEWQAWYIPADVPFSSLSANFEVAKFSDTQTSANEIEIEPVTSGTLTANTPYLVRLKEGKATGEYSIVADESAGLKETVENEVNIGSYYKLKTTYRELSGAELKGKYALSEGKFKKAGDSATLKPFRLYLEPVTVGADNALDIVMDSATSVQTIDNKQSTNGKMYNLNGQAVGNDYKGIVIMNGKKVVKH